MLQFTSTTLASELAGRGFLRQANQSRPLPLALVTPRQPTTTSIIAFSKIPNCELPTPIHHAPRPPTHAQWPPSCAPRSYAPPSPSLTPPPPSPSAASRPSPAKLPPANSSAQHPSSAPPSTPPRARRSCLRSRKRSSARPTTRSPCRTRTTHMAATTGVLSALCRRA